MSTLNPRQQFEIVDALQLLVETENLNPSGYKNYVANPDGALGAWGWAATGGTLSTDVVVDQGHYAGAWSTYTTPPTIYSQGFETDTDGWAANGTAYVAPNRYTFTKRTGTASLQFSLNAATAVVRTITGLIVGASYTLSGWQSPANAGRTGKVGVTGIGDSADVALTVGSWVQCSYTFTATATSHEARLVAISGGTNWDDLTLVQNTYWNPNGGAWVPNLVHLTGIGWTSDGTTDSHVESNGMPVTSGEWVSAQFDVLSVPSFINANIKGHFNFYGVSGALLSSSANDVALTAPGHAQMVGVQVPANAVSCRLAIGLFIGSTYPPSGLSFCVSHVMLTKNATNTFGSIRSNLVPNPSFEVDLNGWTVEG